MGFQRRSTRIVLLCTWGVVLPAVAGAVPIRSFPNIVSVTFWERTGGTAPVAHGFLVGSDALENRIPGGLGSGKNDFTGTVAEFYDVFYSDADGTANLNGEYVSVEASFPAAGSGLNLAEVELHFAGGATRFADFVPPVVGFVGHGPTFVEATVPRAVDGDLATHTAMGNTLGFADRLRVTVGFTQTTPVPEPAAALVLAFGLVGASAWKSRFWRRRTR
jgi:hypothetical protein